MGYDRNRDQRTGRASGPGRLAGRDRPGRERDRRRLRPVLLALEDRRLLSSFTVTNTADDGSPGTLRWAIAQANSATSASVIELQLGTAPATITLAQGQLELSNTLQSIAITDGPGQGPVKLDGNHASRVIQIDNGVKASLSGLTITGGATNSFAGGGGVYNRGTTTITDCTITGNATAGSGGGLGNVGRATLTNCSISGNSGVGGGGVYNRGTATLTNCSISGNTGSSGGGVSNQGTATFTKAIGRT